jgi:hypothetical protein
LQMTTLLLLNLRNLLMMALWALLAFGTEGDRDKGIVGTEVRGAGSG